MEQRKKYIVKKADGGQISPEEMAMMEQQAAAQAQQGAPQQGGGQDEAMQQIMQMVEQMIQQGAQPADVAAELLGQQVPPEAIMQVFVEMGLPEQEAQAVIEQAMQAGPPQEGAPQGPPQGQPSPEEMAAMQQQQGQPPMMSHGGPPPHPAFNPAYTMSAKFGQKDARIEGDPTEQAARDHQTRIGATAKEGMTPAEWAEYRKDLEITKGYTDLTVESQPNYMVPMDNMKAGGDMFRKLMKKAWGGNLTAPAASSEDYVSDRAAMFVNAVKQNTAMATLNESMKGDPFAKAGLPTARLGGLPKFEIDGDVNSETAADDDLAFNEKQQAYIDNLKSGFKKIQAQGQAQGFANPNVNYQGFSGYNPYMNNMTVGYRDPRQFTMMDELQRGTNPWARFLGNTGRTFSNPTIRGNNLPGGMSGADFLSQMKGMSGVGPDGTPYRVSSGEKYVEKDGTFLKNLNPFVRRQPTKRGIRYNIDYGTGLTDGTQEGGASEEGTAPGTSGAMSRQDMLNDMTRNEKREFRKMQRGRNSVSANDAYQRMLDTRGNQGGTEAPSSLEQMRANAAAAGDPLNQTQLEQMRANAAAAGDPLNQTQFDPIDSDELSDQQIYEKKEGERGYIDNQGNVSGTDPNAPDSDYAYIGDNGGQEIAMDNIYQDILNAPESEKAELMAIDGITDEDLAIYEKSGPGIASENRNARIERQNSFPIEEMPLADDAVDPNLPVSSQNQTRKNQKRESFSQFGKKTTKQLQRKGVLDERGNVRLLDEGEIQMPPTAEEMQANADQQAAMEQNAIDETNRQGARELFDAQNPIASSDPTRVKGRTDLLKRVVTEMDPALHARGNADIDVPGVTDVQPEVIAEANEMEFKSPTSDRFRGMGQAPIQPTNMMSADGMTYGGGVSPQALANAVNLINRAFGGSIPQAVNGMDLQGRLSMEEALAKQGLNGSGTVDVETEQGMQWGNKRDLGQGIFNTAKAVTFFDQAGENARAQENNALIAQSVIPGAESYNQMQVGLDNQQGARFNTDFNNQNLNVNSNVGTTFSAFGGQPQMMMYGGQYYQIGGDVDLSPEKLAEFEKAGFVLTRK